MPYRLTNLSELFTWIAEVELPRQHLGEGDLFICFCVERTALRGLCSVKLQREAERILMDRLRPHTTYRMWLYENHPDIAGLPDAAYHGRVAWARALAEEFRE